MLPKKTRYYLANIPHFLRSFPSTLLVLIYQIPAFYLWSSKLKNGIRIDDALPKTSRQFISVIEPALELIQRDDPMRFARLIREIRMIVHIPTMTGAAYSRTGKVCWIDLQKFKFAFDIDHDYGIQLLACFLVHEATHGTLYTRRIIQTKQNYARVEKICCREQERFARRLGMDEITCDILKKADDTTKPPSALERLRAFKECIRRLW